MKTAKEIKELHFPSSQSCVITTVDRSEGELLYTLQVNIHKKQISVTSTVSLEDLILKAGGQLAVESGVLTHAISKRKQELVDLELQLSMIKASPVTQETA